MTNKNTVLIGILSVFIISSCTNSSRTTNSKESSSTGWKYNDSKQGGFEKKKFKEQTPGPGLMFVEGGRLTMGRVQEDVMYGWNNISKTVSVSSFYIDETEVRNLDYVEYLEWIKKHYVYAESGFHTGIDDQIGIAIYEKALPDTLVWRDKLGENKTFVNNYLRHPAFREYPVVGVSWVQAKDYCIWRTDRVNERILIDAGLITEVTEREENSKPFTTDGYLYGDEDYVSLFVDAKQKSRVNNYKLSNKPKAKGQEDDELVDYGCIDECKKNIKKIKNKIKNLGTTAKDKDKKQDLKLDIAAEEEALEECEGYGGGGNKNKKVANKDGRRVRMADGLLLPYYRLPTEAEWEHAALGLIGNVDDENREHRKAYPWNGSGVRNNSKKNQGQIMANFKRGRGDNMGVAGSLNDEADITAPVISYWPNDYGLYNMAGNVSEWVADVYRPITEQTTTADHRPFRGNIFKTNKKNPNAAPGEYPYIMDDQGHIEQTEITIDEDKEYRRNYRKANNINVGDGDIESQIYEGNKSTKDVNENSDEDKATITIDKRNLGEDANKNPINVKKVGNSNEMYDYGEASLISDNARVYKGGSWKDRAYWLNPGTRRFLDQDLSSDCIGFRCAMDRVGGSQSALKQNKRREIDYSKAKQ